jgi:hypothetical protein
VSHVTISGSAGSATNQSIANAGRFRVQDIWSWEEARQPDHIHNVSAHHLIQHLNATVLLSLRVHKV